MKTALAIVLLLSLSGCYYLACSAMHPDYSASCK